MLVLHRSPNISVSHRPHHCRETAGVGKHPGSIVVPGTIQDEILRDLSLPSSEPELLAHVRHMPTLRSLRWKQPTLGFSKRRGFEAVRKPDHSSESFFFLPASCCRARRWFDCSSRDSRCECDRALVRFAFRYLEQG